MRKTDNDFSFNDILIAGGGEEMVRAYLLLGFFLFSFIFIFLFLYHVFFVSYKNLHAGLAMA